jgi:transposase
LKYSQALEVNSIRAGFWLREIDRDLLVWLRSNDVARRLTTIPGIGPVGATALAASVTDPHQFRSGRQFAAWFVDCSFACESTANLLLS